MKNVKKSIVTALLIVLSAGGTATRAFSQEDRWEAVIIQMDRLYADGQLEEALRIAEGIQQSKLGFSPNEAQMERLLLRLRGWYDGMYELDNTEPLLIRIVGVLDSLGDYSAMPSWQYLASRYEKQGRYAEAEPLRARALTLLECGRGTQGPDVVRYGLGNLALNYRLQGKYAKAESLYQRSLDIQEKAKEPDFREIAGTLARVADLYTLQGWYAEAELSYQRSLDIQKKAKALDSLDIARTLVSLANVYKLQGWYARVDTLCKRAGAILKKEGWRTLDALEILEDMVEIYRVQKKYREAEKLYQSVISLWKKAPWERPLSIWGWDSSSRVGGDINQLYEGLAELYYDEGKYRKAASVLRKAIPRDNSLGKYDLESASLRSKLAVFSVAEGAPDDGLLYLTNALYYDDRRLNEYFAISSEREKLQLVTDAMYRYNILSTLVKNEFMGDTTAITTCLNAALRRKGLVLDALSREFHALSNSQSPRITDALRQFRQVCSRLATLTLASPNDTTSMTQSVTIARLQREKMILEEKLSRLSGVYVGRLQSLEVDCQTVSKTLPTGSALVEFICSRTFNFKSKGGEDKWQEYRYVVFVLLAGTAAKPVMVDLGPSESIDRAVREFRQEVARATQDIHELGEIEAERRLAAKGHRVYNAAFAPLKKALGTCNLLFIAPDGDLNLIPFGALQDESGRYLAENYQLNYLSSGRDLLRFQQPVEKGTETVIVADPDYNLSGEERVIEARSLLASNVQLASRGTARSNDLRAIIWERLPGSLQEAEAVSRLLAAEKVRLLTGKEALEEMFKGIQSPRRLHLATHGFFLDDEDKSEWLAAAEQSRGIAGVTARPLLGAVKIENPLLRSGLVLAGANRLGKEELPEGAEDGILTALEISGIPLWGTDLVVLSACETGVGETRRGEGVFGLRRAFQLAGARTVVMSMWDVPDAETQQLMTDFYRRMKAGTGKAKALQEASLALMQARREKVGAAHPYFWAAFVCVGEP